MDKKAHVNTSGWEPDEVKQLDEMVKEARVDRSKLLRALVRKEWKERERNARMLENIKAKAHALES